MYFIVIRRSGETKAIHWYFDDLHNATQAVILAQNAGATVEAGPTDEYITDLDEFTAWLRHDE